METKELIEKLRGISNMRSTSSYKRMICKMAAQRLERLAAYEDSGLEPENMAHWEEWFQAECDGRLVVLPCKVGDTVWMIVRKRPKLPAPEFQFIKRSTLTWLNMHRILQDIGKTVFLTRQEAEAAMKGEGHETDSV